MHLYTIAFMALAITSTYAKIPSEMMSLTNTNVDPCDDFYQYSCGEWMKEHPLKPSDTHFDMSFTVIRANNDQVFAGIIKEQHPILDELWDSCMSFDKITALGNTPLQKDLNRIVNAKTKADVLELVGEFSRTGSKAIVQYVGGFDPKGATMYTLLVRPADLTLSTASYSIGDIAKEYRTYINEVMKLSHFPFPLTKRTRGNGRTVADIVFEIEREIATIQKQKRGDTTPMSIADVKGGWPITVGSFLKGLGLFEKTTIKDDFRMYMESPDYLKALETLITSRSEDDLKVYTAFIMIHSRVQWLGEDYFKAWFKFFGQQLNGQRRPSPLSRFWIGQRKLPSRYSFCMKSLVQYLSDLMGKYYYMKAFDTKKEKDAKEMIVLIKEAMGEHISHSTWLDKKTQKAAKTKLNKVLSLIGQPTVPMTYPSTLSRNDYPTNVYTILSHSMDVEIKKVGKRSNRMEWPSSSTDVNAYYVHDSNSIVLPAAILQPPFFNGPKVHPARNFGAIGSAVGHEITHAFDDTGRTYDGEGNAVQWWSELTAKEFENRARCIKEQYSAFQVNGERGVIGTVNGDLTLNENIADNGGLALAWDAYRKYVTTVQPKTNGVTPEEGDQMFFLAFGQAWCSKTSDETMRRRLTDPHSPSQWRVNGAVMNNDDFARVFKCKANAPMNPIKKCRLW